MKIWYFETSAVNFFMQNHSVGDALATKQFQLKIGRDWRLSPVSLLEILMTSDEIQREKMIYFCQHLFGRELLPSPSELIIPYILQGMPKIEQKRELISHSQFAEVWRDLVDNKNKTFILDNNELKNRVKFVQKQTKDIHDLIKNRDLLISSNETFAGLDISLSNLVNQLPFIKAEKPISSDQLLIYKVALYYIMLILCAEADFDNEPIKSSWAHLNIDSTIDRVFYVVKKLPNLVHRGPFVVMAYMTISQASGKYPRGVWFDSLHSMYMSYVDKIFTTDGHFQGLRNLIPEPVLQQKIHHMNDVKITHYDWNQFEK